MSIELTRRLRTWREAVAGTAAIEFALCIPIFLVLLVGVIEVGFSMYQAMQVSNAAEAGMIYAAKNGWNAAGITTAVTSASGTQGISATPAPVKFCGCPTAGGLATAACDATCVNGNTPGVYVRVSAALSHQTIIPYPGLPLPTTFTAQSTIRLN
jgi:Flp pilus assembly protein TadG